MQIQELFARLEEHKGFFSKDLIAEVIAGRVGPTPRFLGMLEDIDQNPEPWLADLDPQEQAWLRPILGASLRKSLLEYSTDSASNKSSGRGHECLQLSSRTPNPDASGVPQPSSGLREVLCRSSSKLEGQHFMARNGAPAHQPTPAMCLFVDLETQGELDDLWRRLSRGGNTRCCGGPTEMFSLSWPIIAKGLGGMFYDPTLPGASAC